MNIHDKNRLLIKFFDDHKDWIEISSKDVGDWICDQEDGEYSAHHYMYEFVRVVKIFLIHKRKTIYIFNKDKISEFRKGLRK